MHRQRCYITPRPRFPHHCCLINHVLFPRNLSRQAKKRPLCNLFLWLKNNRNASGVQAENKHLHLCHLKMEFLPISLFLSTYLLLVQHLIVSISCSCALRQAKPQKIGYWRHWSLKKDLFFLNVNLTTAVFFACGDSTIPTYSIYYFLWIPNCRFHLLVGFMAVTTTFWTFLLVIILSRIH